MPYPKKNTILFSQRVLRGDLHCGGDAPVYIWIIVSRFHACIIKISFDGWLLVGLLLRVGPDDVRALGESATNIGHKATIKTKTIGVVPPTP